MDNNITQEQIAEMTDEDVLKLDVSQLSVPLVPQEVPSVPDGEVQPTDADTDIDPTPQEQPSTVNGEEQGDGLGGTVVGESPEQTPAVNTPSTVDYEGFYAQLTAPIKAAGREIQIQSAEEAVRLMQQGADYSRKMQQFNQMRSTVKALEEHGINNPETLGYLADLHAGKPEAIARLIKQHKVDLFDFNTDADEGYVPPKAQVPEGVLALEEVIEDLQATSQTFTQTLNTVNNWDEASRQHVTKDPNLLRIIDAEVASGRFDKVDALIQRGKVLGTIPQNTPYLQAYVECEKVILEQEAKTQAPAVEAPKVRAPRPSAKPAPSAQTNHNRVATPGGTSSNTQTQYTREQIANMTDEEVLNLKIV